MTPTTLQPKEPSLLFIAGWWPSAADPHLGIFIKEHALAMLPLYRVAVVFVEFEKWNRPWICSISERRDEDGLDVIRIRIRSPLRRAGLYGALIRRAYRKALREFSKEHKFRLAHIHVRTEITMQATRVARELGWPVIVTEHSSFYHRGIDTLPPGEKARLFNATVEWFKDPNIKAVLPVSADLGRILHERFEVRKELIRVIPNVASEAFHPAPIPSAPPFHLAMVARWEPPKNPLLFVEALALIPKDLLAQIQVTVAGDGGQLLEMRSRIEALGLSQHFRFLGRIGKQQVAELLQQAHLFVHPTDAENLPCVILESLCCGTPVLSHAVNGIPELIDHSNGILTLPGDASALANSLEEILQDLPDRDRMGIATSASTRYHPKAIARSMDAIMRNYLATGEEPRTR